MHYLSICSEHPYEVLRGRWIRRSECSDFRIVTIALISPERGINHRIKRRQYVSDFDRTRNIQSTRIEDKNRIRCRSSHHAYRSDVIEPVIAGIGRKIVAQAVIFSLEYSAFCRQGERTGKRNLRLSRHISFCSCGYVKCSSIRSKPAPGTRKPNRKRRNVSAQPLVEKNTDIKRP